MGNEYAETHPFIKKSIPEKPSVANVGLSATETI
jgi:hypothetical protein